MRLDGTVPSVRAQTFCEDLLSGACFLAKFLLPKKCHAKFRTRNTVLNGMKAYYKYGLKYEWPNAQLGHELCNSKPKGLLKPSIVYSSLSKGGPCAYNLADATFCYIKREVFSVVSP